MVWIERTEYLSWLLRWQDKQIIKVVSGVRRCGKSTLFELFRQRLLANGVLPEQILLLNFEDVANEELLTYRALYDHVLPKLSPERKLYLFLDEVQHVAEFEKAVDSLFLQESCDVYITGSNAYFLSGELATRLSGRYVELKMLPLSFAEFQEGLLMQEQNVSKAEAWNDYLRLGSFPYVVRYGLPEREAREYLRDLYSTVLLKDIVARLKIADVNVLEKVVLCLLSNIGSRTSANKIAATLKSQGMSIDPKTIDRYLRGLTDSLMLYEAKRYDIKGRQHLTTQSKYYAVDVALRNTLVRGQASDIGHVLENVVYLELRRRGYEVFVGQVGDTEVDFVAQHPDGLLYVQVSATTLDEAVLRRELAPLEKIADNYPKLLLTLDEVFGTADYNGIRKMNVLDWLGRDNRAS